MAPKQNMDILITARLQMHKSYRFGDFYFASYYFTIILSIIIIGEFYQVMVAITGNSFGLSFWPNCLHY